MSQDKRDKIMDALNLLDDDIAVETMEARDKGQAGENRPAGRKQSGRRPAGRASGENRKAAADRSDKAFSFRRLRYAGLAACLCLAVVGGIHFMAERDSAGGAENDENKALTILGIFDKSASADGGADYVDDIENFDDGNPWEADKELETLPVFKNCDYLPAGEIVSGLSEEEMAEKLENAAKVMGIEDYQIERDVFDFSSYYDYNSLVREESEPDRKAYPSDEKLKTYDDLAELFITKDGLDIRVDRGGRLSIMSALHNGDDYILELPEEFFSADGSSTDEQADHLLDYLIERYSGLFNFSNPKKISYEETLHNGEIIRHYEVYDGGESYEEELLNYGLGKTTFSISGGRLTGIFIEDTLSCVEKVGDYPVISEEEALKMLLRGENINYYGLENIDEDDVKKVELRYSQGSESHLLPYYWFYVTDPHWEKEGSYILCFVPAIDSKYISGWPDVLKE